MWPVMTKVRTCLENRVHCTADHVQFHVEPDGPYKHHLLNIRVNAAIGITSEEKQRRGGNIHQLDLSVILGRTSTSPGQRRFSKTTPREVSTSATERGYLQSKTNKFLVCVNSIPIWCPSSSNPQIVSKASKSFWNNLSTLDLTKIPKKSNKRK